MKTNIGISERIYRIFAFGLYDRLSTSSLSKNIEHYVAAGNPGKLCTSSDSDITDDQIKNNVLQSPDLFFVSGTSMSPDEIEDGFILSSRPIKQVDEIKMGELIVISVDEDFYRMRHHGRRPMFVLKLRRAIMPVPDGISFEELKEKLIGTFAEVFTKKASKDLKESFTEAKIFYQEERLFLSLTYHNGDIHYSFHPCKSIKSHVVDVSDQKGQKVKLFDSTLIAS